MVSQGIRPSTGIFVGIIICLILYIFVSPVQHQECLVVAREQPREQLLSPVSCPVAESCPTCPMHAASGKPDVTVALKRTPLNLILYVNPVPAQFGGQISEFLWIRDYLLSGLQRPIVTHMGDKHSPVFYNDSLLVVMWRPSVDWMDKIKEQGLTNIGIYQMGDEKFNPKGIAGYYDFVDKVDYTFRNFPSAELLASHMNYHWAFEGSKSGIGSPPPATIPRASLRPTLCMFWGSLRADRATMLSVLQQDGVECDIHKLAKWENADTKHPIVYRLALEHSAFALAPHGNSPESMRLYEALEMGCIPIYRTAHDKGRDPLALLEPHPVPVISTWQEASTLMKRLRADPIALDELQSKIMAWWVKTKADHADKVASVIESSFTKYGR